jgi:hypothetical protein
VTSGGIDGAFGTLKGAMEQIPAALLAGSVSLAPPPVLDLLSPWPVLSGQPSQSTMVKCTYHF